MENSLSDIAYRRIREKVLSGELKAGARLVNRSLGKELGVSTIPVREALRRLASEGFAEHIPGAGTFVRRFERKDLVKLYRFRETIECHAAMEAAQHIQEDQLQQLEALCDKFHDLARAIRKRSDQTSTLEEFEQGLKVDLKYHEIIIEAADNPWLFKTVKDTRLMARIAFSKSHRAVTLGEAARTFRHHAALVRAIKNKDAQWAEYWMKEQIRVGLVTLLNSLEEE